MASYILAFHEVISDSIAEQKSLPSIPIPPCCRIIKIWNKYKNRYKVDFGPKERQDRL